MDSFELNKIIAAVLLVALIIIGIGKLSDAIFYVEKPKAPGYVCLLYTSPSPRDRYISRMPSSA